ncbi:MAG TPA: hypothetical protein VM940_17020 [Chthoniobacterales bacterium]|nr:hypothetical protein [Chthoniobacterales bacterium]
MRLPFALFVLPSDILLNVLFVTTGAHLHAKPLRQMNECRQTHGTGQEFICTIHLVLNIRVRVAATSAGREVFRLFSFRRSGFGDLGLLACRALRLLHRNSHWEKHSRAVTEPRWILRTKDFLSPV